MGKDIRRAGSACLLFFVFIGFTSTPVAAEYPRRVAIAPFVSLAKEEIQQTVSLLPRLLMSRLMALAGAEVVLLPAGEKPPVGQARDAGMPLVLQGTVAKLGKGYSIDVTATEVESGKVAGAFFASPATEDEIIQELGVLSGEIVEKLFGIKTAVRAVTAPPAAVSPATLPPAGAAVTLAASGAPVAAPAPPIAPSGPWEPRSIVQVAVSDKIPDEIYRISSGDADGDGNQEVAAIGSRKLWVYKISGDQVLPFRKMERSQSNLFLNVEMADVDGDGKAEIVVTNLVGNRLQTFVLKYKGEALEQVATDIPYYVISLEDGKGKRRLAGQKMGVSDPFSGKVVYLKWNGKTLVPDGNVPVAVDKGIFGLAAFPGDAEGRFLYIDADEHLRMLDSKGKTKYKSKEYYSGALHMFASGAENRGNVGADRHYIRGRVFPVAPGEGRPVFLVRQAKGNVLFKDTRTFEWSRLVFLAWTGDGFSELVASERIDNLMADFVVLGGKAGPGVRVAVPVIDSSSFVGSFSTEAGASRIRLYRMD
ncbi:MAG: hypothetical protein HW377_145 [Actinobacteria bacterium]|nr:hypothetical protein [Actinomycetota bacterium]